MARTGGDSATNTLLHMFLHMFLAYVLGAATQAVLSSTPTMISVSDK